MTDTSPEPDVPEDLESLEDEAKRKFREALERKHAQEAAAAGGPGGSGTGKVQRTHGPASTRRSFRRKGGG